MIAKVFEIRDEGTVIMVLAVKLLPHDQGERQILVRAGYDYDEVVQGQRVMLMDLSNRRTYATTGPTTHKGGRTMRQAHLLVELHFDVLLSGAVIDVAYLLGETDHPCASVFTGASHDQSQPEPEPDPEPQSQP